MSLNIVAVIQARCGSTRLPNKILLPLAGRPMLANIVDRVLRAKLLTSVVVAYPLKDHDAIMRALNQRTEEANVGIYASQDDENDLVVRHLSACMAHSIDIVVRIPSDNAMVEPAYIDRIIARYLDFPSVFLTNTTDIVGEQYVDGVGAEVFSRSRLQWLDWRTQGAAKYREHPHLWFYENGFVAPYPKNILRLDVNDSKDYEFIKMIYDHFGHNRFTTEEVLGYLDHKKEAEHAQA